MPPKSTTANGIITDIENGDEAIRLTDLPRAKFIPKKDGRAPHVSACFRWAQKGLETLKTPAGLITTRSAWLRYCARLSGISSATVVRSQAKRERQIDRAEHQLEAMGL